MIEPNAPRVSVVITAFNRAELLRVTLRSLLEQQTLAPSEVIVCDDASDDHTQDVCKIFALRDNRVRVVRHETNVGMPQNLNSGIAVSRGDYIVNLHEDDEISHDLLAKWVDSLDRCPNATFVFNAYEAESREGDPVRTYSENLAHCNPGSRVLEQLFFGRWRFDSPVWGTVMVRRQAYDIVGPFDERFGFLADVDMWMRLWDIGEVAYVDEPLIRIVSQDRAPHFFAISRREHRRLVQTMFLEARRRHFHGWKLKFELVRHEYHIAMNTVYWEMLRVRRVAQHFVATGRHFFRVRA
jgi:glycosyltransferase involved in cell wall biosynthesis